MSFVAWGPVKLAALLWRLDVMVKNTVKMAPMNLIAIARKWEGKRRSLFHITSKHFMPYHVQYMLDLSVALKTNVFQWIGFVIHTTTAQMAQMK